MKLRRRISVDTPKPSRGNLDFRRKAEVKEKQVKKKEKEKEKKGRKGRKAELAGARRKKRRQGKRGGSNIVDRRA